MKAPPGEDTHLTPQGRLTIPVWLLREPSSTARLPGHAPG